MGANFCSKRHVMALGAVLLELFLFFLLIFCSYYVSLTTLNTKMLPKNTQRSRARKKWEPCRLLEFVFLMSYFLTS